MAEMFISPHVTPVQLGLNINDIIDVIADDKDYGNPDMSCFARGGTQSEVSAGSSTLSRNDPDIEQKRKAYVQITEQPQPKALRFRYICEGRSAGSIPGVNSAAENKTYPSIKILNYKGPAVVVVSCVTVDPPYRPHPHNLVGKEGCSKGVCTVTIDNDTMDCIFSNLGIQCVKKKDVDQALKLREEIRVDPFGTGFTHRNQPQNIDLNAVRLCFQVFLSNGKNGRFTYPLKPVVSNPIYDKKATSDLNICKLSECTSSVAGGKEIILLCDKVTKEDIQVRFYEEKDGRLEWEAFGDFLASDVHKQVAISFKTPKYKDLEVQHSINCYIQLHRPSDKSTSEPRPFEYLPMDAGRPFQSFKRLKNNYGLFHRILGLDNPVVISDDALPHKITNSQPPLPSTTNINNWKLPPTSRCHSPPLLNQIAVANLPASPQLSNINKLNTAQPTITENQTIDDIKQRMTANLDRNKGIVTFGTNFPLPQFNRSPQWSDEASVFSEADILDEVLSQGSVNDILSCVGDGLAVYEDVDALVQSADVNQDAIDALYGDASYASCYSNLEFAMGRMKSSTINQEQNSNLKYNAVPLLPPKKSIRNCIQDNDDDDFRIYGTPSGRPIHPNKETLLRERGFLTCHDEDSEGRKDLENNLFYTPVSDILEVDEEVDHNSKEINLEEVPQTILDLFV